MFQWMCDPDGTWSTNHYGGLEGTLAGDGPFLVGGGFGRVFKPVVRHSIPVYRRSTMLSAAIARRGSSASRLRYCFQSNETI